MLLEIIRAILAQPTAPFHEDAVRGEILIQLAQCKHVEVKLDGFGNVIARYARGEGEGRYGFVAHMDHPGYVGEEFLGGVPEVYLKKKPAVRDCGAFSVWDLPGFEFREGRIYSRACDDLIGCAAMVAMFFELERRGVEAQVSGFFTRAEEVGFVGTIYLAKSGVIDRGMTLISLETSSEKGGTAKMGGGVVVRVGDRSTIFDPEVTSMLMGVAGREGIEVQRCLMSGGSCEATAYGAYGYAVGGMCVALGNYHNCGDGEEIASEYVALRDVEGMVGMMVGVAMGGWEGDGGERMRGKLEENFEKYRGFF